jgi:hypothetical protein
MDLSAALAEYDRVALNLQKLDRVWKRMEELLPDGPFLGAGSDEDVLYTQLGEQWTTITRSLPAIHGWRLDAQIIDYAAIGRARLERVAVTPNLSFSGGSAQFMDLAGDGLPDLVVLDGPNPGLYEHDDDQEGWGPFRPFAFRPNRRIADPNNEQRS